MSNYFARLAQRSGLERPAAARQGRPPQGPHTRPAGLEVDLKKTVQPQPRFYPASESSDHPMPSSTQPTGDQLEDARLPSELRRHTPAGQTASPVESTLDGGHQSGAVKKIRPRNTVDADAARHRPPPPQDPIPNLPGGMDGAQTETMTEGIAVSAQTRSGRLRRGRQQPYEGDVRPNHAKEHPADPLHAAGRSVHGRPSAMHRQESPLLEVSTRPDSDTIDHRLMPAAEAPVLRHATAAAGPEPQVCMVPPAGQSQAPEPIRRLAVIGEVPPPRAMMGEKPERTATRQPNAAVDIRIGTISVEVHPAASKPLPTATPVAQCSPASPRQPTRSPRLSRYYLKGW